MANHLSEHAELERSRRENEDGGVFVDMRLDVDFGGEVLISVGGRWNRRLAAYDPVVPGTELGDPAAAETAITVYPHAGEIPTLVWFMSWLAAHVERRDNPPELTPEAIAALEAREVELTEVSSALFAGGRRGGKTWTAAIACVLYAILFPDAIVWIVNPTDQKHDEVRVLVAELLADDWVTRYTAADGWELVNGSVLMLKSAYVGSDPDAIKEGKAHLVWLNEGQKMVERVYIVARGATVDQSGLVVVCANPPVQAKDQQWVVDFAADAQAQRRLSAYFQFDPQLNPHINRLALMALRYELDDRAYRIEVLGEFLPPAERVAYNWSRVAGGNERTMPGDNDPDWWDCTSIFMTMEDIGDNVLDLPGMDFQVHPHIGGPVYRIFAPRGHAPTRKNVAMWGVDEIVLEGDEAEWCYEAKERGYDPETTLIVGDGTGEYQHTRRRSVDSPPPHWEGRGSFDIIKMSGYPRIIRPSPRIRRNNPHVVDRCRSLTSMIESQGVRRYFLDPERCPKTCKAIREWPTVHGKPSRTHEAAHLGDGASYPVVRLFPRIFRSEKPGQMELVTRWETLPPPARPTGFGRPPASARRRPGRSL
jgi:hypothetical protein